ADVDVDREPLAQRRDQRLLDGRDSLAAALDLHRVSNAQHLLLDPEQLRSGGILEHERLPHPQCLAVHLERALAFLVLDPEVVADREHPFAHPVPRPALVTPAPEQRHRSSPSVLFWDSMLTPRQCASATFSATTSKPS